MLTNFTEILKAKDYLIVMKKLSHILDGDSGQETDFGDHVHLQRYTEEWVQDRGDHKPGTLFTLRLSSDPTDKALEVRHK